MRRSRNDTTKSGPLNMDELAMHVTSQYISGPGGIFTHADARRKRQEAASLLNGRRNEDNKAQVEHLKNLDRHPTLVLNGDYQVSDILAMQWNHLY